MEHFKVAAAVGLNGMMAAAQTIAETPITETLLIIAQIGVAVVTTLYIGTKVWCLWRGNKKD